MGRSSTDKLPDFLKGVTAVLAHLPGAALVTDAKGRLLFANRSFCNGAFDPSSARDVYPLPDMIRADTLGTDQPGYHALTLPSGRRTGVSCVRVTDGDGATFIIVREDARQAVVAKFATAQEGLLRSQMERDRARAAERKMKAEATHWRLMSMQDRLTGLLNATGFRDRMTEVLNAGRNGVLIYADLNGFKLVNDTLGHTKGDRLLRDIGQALLATIRVGDFVGRLGGDEFGICLTDCPSEEIENVADRIRKSMSRRIPVKSAEVGGAARIISVSAAMGTAIFPLESSDYEELIQLADQRMYEDKAESVPVRRGG